jgi:ABC-type polysaccharide/polyol phosphate export permease
MSVASFLALAVLLAVSAVGLTGLGFVIAWKMDSTQGFHAIMNLLLMPMWLLSGAFFPPPAWNASATLSDRLMHLAMRCNPLTYCVAGARQLLYGSGIGDFWQPSLAVCWLVATGFALITLLIATLVSRQRTTGDLL